MDYTEDEYAECRADAEAAHSREIRPALTFGFHTFLSRSKGRNRPRTYPATVELYTFGNGRGRWYTSPPFDVWAGEAYNLDYSQPEAFGLADRLRNDIRQGVI